MARRIEGAREQIYINVRFPPGPVEEMDVLIRKGKFSSRSDIVRTAVRDYLDWIKEQES